jgi:hypothetical protein
VVPLQFSEGGRLASADGLQKIFGLVAELIQVGVNGDMALGHDGPPSVEPVSAGSGERRFV